MGQGVRGVPEAAAVGAADDREPIGRYLAQQRKLRGVDLDDLAARTRIPRRSLERLEAGAFDHSPDGFSRGFVRTVAEANGLDPDDAVARMLPEPDAQIRGGPRWERVAAALAAVAALVVVTLFAAARVFAPPAPAFAARDGELPVRRDYVRELAQARGIAASDLGARAAVIALEPARVAEPVAETEVASEGAPAVAAVQRAPTQSAPPAATPVASAPAPPPAPPASTSRAETEAPPPSAPPAPARGAANAAPALSASATAAPVSEPAPLPADSASEPDAEAHD
ncbi:MAG: helix-turn-helix domain-containing protein [Deltaproteobacteria bacterium]|nr:helix-turn-helix domain-containing protein [Deltaproteobacteria bacterium]